MAVFSGWTPLTDGGWLHATFILKSNRVDTTNAKLPFGIFKSDHCYFICGPDRLRPGKWDCGKWSVSEIGEHEKPRGSHRMMPSTGVKITTIIS